MTTTDGMGWTRTTRTTRTAGTTGEAAPFAVPSSRNLLSPEGVQAVEEFFQAREG